MEPHGNQHWHYLVLESTQKVTVGCRGTSTGSDAELVAKGNQGFCCTGTTSVVPETAVMSRFWAWNRRSVHRRCLGDFSCWDDTHHRWSTPSFTEFLLDDWILLRCSYLLTLGPILGAKMLQAVRQLLGSVPADFASKQQESLCCLKFGTKAFYCK